MGGAKRYPLSAGWSEANERNDAGCPFSSARLPHLHVPSIDALAWKRPVVDVFGHAEQQLVPPEKVCRGVLGDDAHGLAENFFPLLRIESLTLRRQKLI